MKKINRNRTLRLTLGIALLAAFILFTLASRELSASVLYGLKLCCSVVIPSMFPFMVLSAITVNSGLAMSSGRFFAPVTRKVFGLPGCCAPAMLMGLLGGYPVGATAAVSLYQQGALTKKQVSRLLCICVVSGPGFVLSGVGATLLRNMKLAAVIYASHLLPCLILGIAMNILLPLDKKEAAIKPRAKSMPFSACFVQSVNDCARTLLSVTAFITFFAAITRLIARSGLPALIFSRYSPNMIAILSASFSSLLEVSSGCVQSVSTGQFSAVILIPAALSFGGLSVWSQVFSIAHGTGISMKPFVVTRFLAAALSGYLSFLFLGFFPLSVSVFSTISTPLEYAFSSSIPASLAILALCGFVLAVNGKKAGI